MSVGAVWRTPSLILKKNCFIEISATVCSQNMSTKNALIELDFTFHVTSIYLFKSIIYFTGNICIQIKPYHNNN